jgi:membrane-associated phospholipid phosphatase
MKNELRAVAQDGAVVAVCAAASGIPEIRRLDDRAFEALHRSMASSRKRRILWWILSQAGWFGSAVLVSSALTRKGRYRAGLRVLVSAGFAWTAAQALKRATGIDRPWDRLDGVTRTGGIPSGTAFPSGHPAVAAAVAGALRADDSVPKVLAWGMTVLSVLVPPARIGVGAHYPLDVLAGFFLGDMVSRIVRLILR